MRLTAGTELIEKGLVCKYKKTQGCGQQCASVCVCVCVCVWVCARIQEYIFAAFHASSLQANQGNTHC